MVNLFLTINVMYIILCFWTGNRSLISFIVPKALLTLKIFGKRGKHEKREIVNEIVYLVFAFIKWLMKRWFQLEYLYVCDLNIHSEIEPKVKVHRWAMIRS